MPPNDKVFVAEIEEVRQEETAENKHAKSNSNCVCNSLNNGERYEFIPIISDFLT